MDANVLAIVRKEEGELLQKLAAVRALLAAYGQQPIAEMPQAPTIAPVSVKASVVDLSVSQRGEPSPISDKRSIENFTPYGRAAIATAMSFLVGQTAPVKTRELVQALKGIGFTIRGDNEINALGALLGRSQEIVSHGKMGWTLANSERASEIVGKYAQKENEPPSASAGGSDAVKEGVQPPNSTQDQSNWGRDA